MSGFEIVEYHFDAPGPRLVEAAFDHLPDKLRETGVEALVLDAIHHYLELVPMSMGIPYVHIWNVLHLDFTGSTPICLFGLPYGKTPEALAKNFEVLQQAGALLAPIAAIAMRYAEKAGLEIDWANPTGTFSKLAIITQTPKEFDFPDLDVPPQFHYAGPFHSDGGREPAPFPWEKLTGKPLIYASLGTLVNGLIPVYKTILAAVAKVPEAQVVLSVGKNVNTNELGPIPSNVIVVARAPQIELLKQAALCITHAGANTALEALAQGVPMVAIPIGFDQPGVAARIAYHGVGEFVEVEDLTVDRLLGLIEKVLTNQSYRERALQFKKIVEKTNGLEIAADIIERAFQTNQKIDFASKDAVLQV